MIAEVGTDDMTALRRALRDAFPFGPRQHHPYKIWLHEVRCQLGLVEMGKQKKQKKSNQPPSCDGQRSLFDE